MITPESPIVTVLGESNKSKQFAKLGLETVGDLLEHLPRRYLKTGELTELDSLRPGQQLIVVGRIASNRIAEYRDRRTNRTAYRVEVVVQTGGQRLKMTFFAKHRNTAQWQADRMPVGVEGVFTGQAKEFRGEWQLTHPDMVMFNTADGVAGKMVADRHKGLFPIYPLTKGLQSWDVQRAVTFALTVLDDTPDPVPESVRRDYRLIDHATALNWVHNPDTYSEVGAALKRMRFQEALVTQLVLARKKAEIRRQGTRSRAGGGGLLAEFDARLPFELTADQERVGAEIAADLAEAYPMNRLLQGEVGSGKTLVALRAMLRVIDSGGQAALLAPTEVLAQQHYRSITAMLGDLAGGGLLGGADESTRVVLLTGSMTKKQRAQALSELATGEAGIVVGTHALLEDRVGFLDLGLVVVDEQHRFGVEQRAALTDKAERPPHLLVMTATPIPRTVAMTVFGALETSTITELPAGRAEISTVLVPVREHPHWYDRAWQRIREEVAKGRQAYVVCPRIGGDVLEEGETDQVDYDEDGNPVESVTTSVAAVEQVTEMLTQGPLEGLRVEMLHGRLTPDEKDRTMRAFADGKIDVLVSTTVIEVGVDVPNASVMVLLDADRFGVSQLHQLRGRVGRGGLPGLCLLVTQAEAESAAYGRLTAVAATTDGFELSQVDLETRREGDVLGESQSGRRSSLRMLQVLRDEDTIVAAREAAERLLAEDPDLNNAKDLAALVDELEASRESGFMEKW